MASGEFYTREELEKADGLQRQGYSYRELAERFGRSVWSLKVHVSRFRRGLWKGCFVETKKETEQMIAEIEDGATITQVAKKRGYTLERVCERFKRAGFDADMRREARQS
jgi:transposase